MSFFKMGLGSYNYSL